MQTRKSGALKKTNIRDLLLEEKNAKRVKLPKIKKRVQPDLIKFDEEPVAPKFTIVSTPIIPAELPPPISVSPPLPANIPLPPSPPQVQKVVKREKSKTFAIIDTESFRMNNEETLLPLQIACNVYEWNERTNELMLKAKYSSYISEVLLDEKYRSCIPKKCLQRHELNLQQQDIQLTSASQILTDIRGLLLNNEIQPVLTCYNISWDFLAIANLVNLFGPSPGYDPACDNPFNPMALNYLDLMHEIVKKYGRELTEIGINDGTVHRANDSNRLLLRKNNKFSKSIYSAEYVLSHYFGVSQIHMAQTDVSHEALILGKCLSEHGYGGLEYNVCYPQVNCYQRMLHLANEMYSDSSSSSDSDVEKIEENPKGKEELSNNTQSKQKPSKRDECLFEESLY